MSTKATLPADCSGAIPDRASKPFRRATCSHRRRLEAPRRARRPVHRLNTVRGLAQAKIGASALLWISASDWPMQKANIGEIP